MLRLALALVLLTGIHGATHAQETTAETRRTPLAPTWAPRSEVGFVSIVSDAPARLFVDGHDLGFAPLYQVRMWPGDHELELRYVRGGTLRSRLRVTAGDRVTRRIAAP
ncbi:MAG: hypothetical protein R3B99_18255 [Polyangiales bacterium]|nr:hypothetical protein [Sandaracinus sp.]